MAFRFRPLIGIALAVLITGGAVAAALLLFAERPRRETTIPTSIPIGGPFTLTASDGETVTDQTYQRKWLLVYFGCTFCSDASSDVLKAMGEVLEKLGPAANEVQPLFITIDPERDTSEVLARYMISFDRRIVGLTGTAEQIATVANEYRVYYASKIMGDRSIVEHSSFVYLVSPQGKLAKFFAGSTSGILIADELQQILTQSPSGQEPQGHAFFTPPQP